MTERERLIELIQKSVNGCARNWAETIADYLLSNGVIVPPCKFNDDLWWIDDDNTVRCQERAIKTICCHENGTFSIIDTDGNEDKIGTRYAYITKEEAEKALEDMKGGAD